MSSEVEEKDVATLRAMIDVAPLADVIEAVRAQRERLKESAPDHLDALEDDLCLRVARHSHTPWNDRKKAAQAFRYYLDVTLERGREDGDTQTWALVRALEQDPDDDDLLRDYVRAVADTDYRYTDLSLAEISEGIADAARARWLATLDTLTEYFCLRAHLDPPKQVYVEAQMRSFANAVARGADEAHWMKARQWVLEAAPYAEVPEHLFARYAK